MVLYRIVRPARQEVSYQGPPISQSRSLIMIFIPLMSLYDSLILLISPLILRDLRIQMVMKPTIMIIIRQPLSTLLTNPAGKILSNMAPIFGSILLHQPQQRLILFYRPWSLHQLRIQHLLPPMQTLNIRSIFEE